MLMLCMYVGMQEYSYICSIMAPIIGLIRYHVKPENEGRLAFESSII